MKIMIQERIRWGWWIRRWIWRRWIWRRWRWVHVSLFVDFDNFSHKKKTLQKEGLMSGYQEPISQSLLLRFVTFRTALEFVASHPRYRPEEIHLGHMYHVRGSILPTRCLLEPDRINLSRVCRNGRCRCGNNPPCCVDKWNCCFRGVPCLIPNKNKRLH